MPVFKERSVLGGMKVKEAMQRQVISLPSLTPISQCIRHLIKFKANAVMVTDSGEAPLGVVSKTDIMGAYYAGIPVESGIGDIMTGPPVFCRTQDSIEHAIDLLQANCIHQLYVQSADNGHLKGFLSYSDIMGLLYRYCRSCIKSGRPLKAMEEKNIPRLCVKDVMTKGVESCKDIRSIEYGIEVLSQHQLGAILVSDSSGQPCGVISKTDLVLAYARDMSLKQSVKTVMNRPVVSCRGGKPLSKAIQQMFLSDVQRIFVKEENSSRITGVLSLSDATRFRSGTCKACAAGRILDTA